MSIFTSFGIILLAMLIQGFLQTAPAIFSIFYHHALGKTTAKKADDRSLSFILGVEIFIAIIFLTTYLATAFIILNTKTIDDVFLYVMAGIFIMESIITFFFYFRFGKKNKKTTRLFIPRQLARSLEKQSKEAKNRTDTIILGFVTSALELFFTIPLFIISSVEIIKLEFNTSFIFIIAYIIIATIPLFAIRTIYRKDHNLADIERFRIKKKPFFRLIISISYLLIAILLIISGIYK